MPLPSVHSAVHRLMILCHQHKFLFIKSRKTAGTSVEVALSRDCGPQDIITPIWPADEAIRQELGYRGPQNYLVPYSKLALHEWYKLLTSRKRARYIHHTAAASARARLPRAVWDSYFRFTIERNPWDKVISLYYFFHPAEPRPTLDEFIRTVDRSLLSNYHLYSINGEVVVDRVLRYEHLLAELNEVMATLGLPPFEALPKCKTNFRQDRRPYQDVLTPEHRDIIATACAREIELLGYTFD